MRKSEPLESPLMLTLSPMASPLSQLEI
jgi:hypothetical protein